MTTNQKKTNSFPNFAKRSSKSSSSSRLSSSRSNSSSPPSHSSKSTLTYNPSTHSSFNPSHSSLNYGHQSLSKENRCPGCGIVTSSWSQDKWNKHLQICPRFQKRQKLSSLLNTVIPSHSSKKVATNYGLTQSGLTSSAAKELKPTLTQTERKPTLTKVVTKNDVKQVRRRRKNNLINENVQQLRTSSDSRQPNSPQSPQQTRPQSPVPSSYNAQSPLYGAPSLDDEEENQDGSRIGAQEQQLIDKYLKKWRKVKTWDRDWLLPVQEAHPNLVKFTPHTQQLPDNNNLVWYILQPFDQKNRIDTISFMS